MRFKCRIAIHTFIKQVIFTIVVIAPIAMAIHIVIQPAIETFFSHAVVYNNYFGNRCRRYFFCRRFFYYRFTGIAYCCCSTSRRRLRYILFTAAKNQQGKRNTYKAKVFYRHCFLLYNSISLPKSVKMAEQGKRFLINTFFSSYATNDFSPILL